MGVGSGCGEQEVGVASGSWCNIWVWLVGVVVRRYICRFPHTTYPYSSSDLYISVPFRHLAFFFFLLILLLLSSVDLAR